MRNNSERIISLRQIFLIAALAAHALAQNAYILTSAGVSDPGDNTVTAISAASHTPFATIPVGAKGGVAFSLPAP